jgi:hypothetical protein
MKPCDCKDIQDLQKLNETGIGSNDDMLKVIPNYVELTLGPMMVKISMRRFRQFAEWYLKDQSKEKE